jgi:hypothetical protein
VSWNPYQLSGGRKNRNLENFGKSLNICRADVNGGIQISAGYRLYPVS